jgi:hypothetical protein
MPAVPSQRSPGGVVPSFIDTGSQWSEMDSTSPARQPLNVRRGTGATYVVRKRTVVLGGRRQCIACFSFLSWSVFISHGWVNEALEYCIVLLALNSWLHTDHKTAEAASCGNYTGYGTRLVLTCA